MVIPTLLVKGSLIPTSNKTTKEVLDNYVPIHWILGLIDYKLKKPNPNIHDRILNAKSLVGSGKTTVLVVETFRRFFNTKPYTLEDSKSFRDPVDFDYSIFDYPDDEYTIQNRKVGFPTVIKKAHKIICSQPKVILASSKAIEVASEERNPDLEFGFNVGFKTGVAKSEVTSPSQIIYCTMGTLTQMLKTKPDEEWLSEYEIIMIDEAHERSLELDEGLAYLRDLLRRNAGNPSFPLIVCMSATFDIEKYAKYLGTEPSNSVEVTGGAVSREFKYIDHDSENVYKEAAVMAMELNKNDDPEDHCDILIFSPGESEIKKIKDELTLLDKGKELFITVLTAEINNKDGPEMNNILRKTLAEIRQDSGVATLKRRVTIATPVVETGLTIVTAKYVIDTCLVKSTAFSPVHSLSQLVKQGCSLASLEQRAGRVGRVKFGYVYRLMREELMKGLDEYSRPALYTTDLSKVILDMQYAGIDFGETVKPMSGSTFESFIEECMDVTHYKLNNKTENCKCMYNDMIGDDSRVVKQKTFLAERKIKTYPEEMLDKIPTDTYMMARNKLLSLGFYGTYVGYLASKINRLSVEAIRMVMAGCVYGVNLNDLIVIGLFVGTGERKYRYDFRDVQKLNREPGNRGKVVGFNSFSLMKKIISKSTFKKHFGGDDSLFVTQLYDEFIEPLFVMKWYADTVRKHGPSESIKKGRQMGINLQSVYAFMDSYAQVQEAFAKAGFTSMCKSVDFNSNDVFDTLIRIKKCVHAGYKNNLAYLTEDGVRYRTNTGLVITPQSIQSKFRPKKIVFGHLFLKVKPGTIFYEAVPTYICALDGII